MTAGWWVAWTVQVVLTCGQWRPAVCVAALVNWSFIACVAWAVEMPRLMPASLLGRRLAYGRAAVGLQSVIYESTTRVAARRSSIRRCHYHGVTSPVQWIPPSHNETMLSPGPREMDASWLVSMSVTAAGADKSGLRPFCPMCTHDTV